MFYLLGKGLIRVIAGLDMLLGTTVLYLLSFLPHRFTHRWYPKLFQIWCTLFIRALGVNLKVHQKNLQALPKHFMVIGNHPSAFEDIGLPAIFKARFLAKEEIKDWWILGRISLAANTLYVKRESKESRTIAREAIIQALQKGDNIGLYPEGGCKGRRVFLPFHYGCFDIAIQTDVPIIPVFLHYEAQEDFEWGLKESLVQKIWAILKAQNKTVNYYVFDAIHPSQFANHQSLCQYVQNLYLKWQVRYLE
jgi:1-acyl-sn-glycerol-3-phosphate acyltransferase